VKHVPTAPHLLCNMVTGREKRSGQQEGGNRFETLKIVVGILLLCCRPPGCRRWTWRC
jgi:hypothetical protein